MELAKLKQIIEGALMASGEVLAIERIQLLFDDYDQPKSNQIKQALDSLIEDYKDRGIELIEVASGYRFQVRKEVAPWVTRLWEEKPQRYSRALLETLSLIAYRQPITRGDIEDVRGVAVSSNIIRTLLDREWVRVVGHRDVPGRPAMYATTKQFLNYFSLKSLDELPSLDEIREIDDANQSLDLINAEKKASVNREYTFASEEEVAARGEEVLAETELELEQAEKLMRQVEDNVFNQPEENTDEEEKNSLAALADKAQQRLTSSDSDSESNSASNSDSNSASSVDVADKIAEHQARLASADNASTSIKSADAAEERELTLLEQQEQLMQKLLREQAEKNSLFDDWCELFVKYNCKKERL